MDGRTIEEIRFDCARNMIRDLLLLPDEYVIVVNTTALVNWYTLKLIIQCNACMQLCMISIACLHILLTSHALTSCIDFTTILYCIFFSCIASHN